MAYDYSKLAVLRTIRRNESYGRVEWYPSGYVVAHTGGNLVIDRDEEIAEKIIWGAHPTPVRFTNVEEDDILYETDARNGRQAYAARILLSQFDEEDLDCPSGCVPTVIAVEGRPMLSMYLLAFERMEWQETADFLDISRYTITKYRERLRNAIIDRESE